MKTNKGTNQATFNLAKALEKEVIHNVKDAGEYKIQLLSMAQNNDKQLIRFTFLAMEIDECTTYTFSTVATFEYFDSYMVRLSENIGDYESSTYKELIKKLSNEWHNVILKRNDNGYFNIYSIGTVVDDEIE